MIRFDAAPIVITGSSGGRAARKLRQILGILGAHQQLRVAADAKPALLAPSGASGVPCGRGGEAGIDEQGKGLCHTWTITKGRGLLDQGVRCAPASCCMAATLLLQFGQLLGECLRPGGYVAGTQADHEVARAARSHAPSRPGVPDRAAAPRCDGRARAGRRPARRGRCRRSAPRRRHRRRRR